MIHTMCETALFRQERQTSFTINPHFRFADFHADF